MSVTLSLCVSWQGSGKERFTRCMEAATKLFLRPQYTLKHPLNHALSSLLQVQEGRFQRASSTPHPQHVKHLSKHPSSSLLQIHVSNYFTTTPYHHHPGHQDCQQVSG